MKHSFSWELFTTMPLVGIARSLPAEQMETLAGHYRDAGLTTLEITLNTKGAEATIRSLVHTYGHSLNIGAGTVCTLTDLDKALAAGAGFIVTPILAEEVIRACVAEKIPVFPGAYTPTEIYRAWSLGADMVKVFPASRLGVEYIKEVRAPLNHIKLMPTGGVTLENCTSFLNAGASALGLGSNLFPRELIQRQDWVAVKDIFTQFADRLRAVLHPNADGW